MASMSPQLLMVVGEALPQRVVAGLSARGWQVSHAEQLPRIAGQASAFLARTPEAIGQIHSAHPNTPVVMLTERLEVALAFESLRAGAADVLSESVTPCGLVETLENAARHTQNELRAVAFDLSVPLGFEQIAGSAPAFLATLASAAKSARTRSPVLIEGEPGTGKATIARAIHLSSSRSGRPFVEMDARHTPVIEMESCLFGHEKGAFPGAFARAPGRFREAEGGTLLLRNPDYLPAAIQDKVAHVVRTGEVQALGARGFREVDVRVVATSTGALGGDLFEQLAATRVFAPPLRARRTDIIPLASHLLARIGSYSGVRVPGITDAALALLSAYDWPGNVSQLLGALFRAAAKFDGEVLDAGAFPQIAGYSVPERTSGKLNGAAVTLYQSDGHLRPLEAIEADVIRLAIGHYRGRMSEVARRLGIGRSTLYRKLDDLGISEES